MDTAILDALDGANFAIYKASSLLRILTDAYFTKSQECLNNQHYADYYISRYNSISATIHLVIDLVESADREVVKLGNALLHPAQQPSEPVTD